MMITGLKKGLKTIFWEFEMNEINKINIIMKTTSYKSMNHKNNSIATATLYTSKTP